MKLLEIKLTDNDRAWVSAPPRASLPVLQKLLEASYHEYVSPTESADGYRTLSESCLRYFDRILGLLPRHDSLDPLMLAQISETELIRLFVQQMGENLQPLPCKLIEFLKYEPCKSTKEVPDLADEITPDNIPIPSSGDADADLLGTLLCLSNGDAMSAQLLYETWDAETIDKALFAYNERQRDPRERMREYKLKEFERIKAENAKLYDKLRKGKIRPPQ